MSIECVVQVIFYVAVGALFVLWGGILWKVKQDVAKGDVVAAYWGLRGISFLSRKAKDRILIKALDNRDAQDLELAKVRRRNVVKLLSKIPSLKITKTGLDEEELPSRR